MYSVHVSMHVHVFEYARQNYMYMYIHVHASCIIYSVHLFRYPGQEMNEKKSLYAVHVQCMEKHHAGMFAL